jgi:hypothetical protein
LSGFGHCSTKVDRLAAFGDAVLAISPCWLGLEVPPRHKVPEERLPEYLLWLYATSGHRLIAAEVTPKIVTSMTRRICVAPALSAVAVAGSFVDVWLGKALFLAIPMFYFSQRLVDAGWHEVNLRRGAPPEKTP